MVVKVTLHTHSVVMGQFQHVPRATATVQRATESDAPSFLGQSLLRREAKVTLPGGLQLLCMRIIPVRRSWPQFLTA